MCLACLCYLIQPIILRDRLCQFIDELHRLNTHRYHTPDNVGITYASVPIMQKISGERLAWYLKGCRTLKNASRTMLRMFLGQGFILKYINSG